MPARGHSNAGPSWFVPEEPYSPRLGRAARAGNRLDGDPIGSCPRRPRYRTISRSVVRSTAPKPTRCNSPRWFRFCRCGYLSAVPFERPPALGGGRSDRLSRQPREPALASLRNVIRSVYARDHDWGLARPRAGQVPTHPSWGEWARLPRCQTVDDGCWSVVAAAALVKSSRHVGAAGLNGRTAARVWSVHSATRGTGRRAAADLSHTPLSRTSSLLSGWLKATPFECRTIGSRGARTFH